MVLLLSYIIVLLLILKLPQILVHAQNTKRCSASNSEDALDVDNLVKRDAVASRSELATLAPTQVTQLSLFPSLDSFQTSSYVQESVQSSTTQHHKPEQAMESTSSRLGLFDFITVLRKNGISEQNASDEDAEMVIFSSSSILPMGTQTLNSVLL